MHLRPIDGDFWQYLPSTCGIQCRNKALKFFSYYGYFSGHILHTVSLLFRISWGQSVASDGNSIQRSP